MLTALVPQLMIRLKPQQLKKLWANHAYKIAISSTKSMTGHLLGGSGGIEAVATVLAIANDQIPPTINLENPDPECDLDYVAPLLAALKKSRWHYPILLGLVVTMSR